MSRAILNRFFIYFIVCILFIVIFGILILMGKRLIKHEQAPPYSAEWIKKHENALNTVVKSLIGVISVVMIIYCIIPSIMDLPSIINKDYKVIRGRVVTQALTKDAKTQSVKIQNDMTGKVVHVQFYYRNYIHRGDVLEVWYLPYTRMGTLISIVKTDNPW